MHGKVEATPPKQGRNGRNSEENVVRGRCAGDNDGKVVGTAEPECFPQMSGERTWKCEKNTGEAMPTSTAEIDMREVLRGEGGEKRTKGKDRTPESTLRCRVQNRIETGEIF
jgi:hypothetical protein